MAEAEEAELRVEQLKKGWRAPRVLVQAIVAGVVGGGLLTAWGVGYLKPILSAQTELAAIETQTLEAARKDLLAETELLEAEQSVLQAEQQELNETNELLVGRLNVLTLEKQQALENMDAASDEGQRLQAEIAELQAQTDDARERALDLYGQCIFPSSCIDYSGGWGLGASSADCAFFGGEFVARSSLAPCETENAVGACRLSNTVGLTTNSLYYSGSCPALAASCDNSGGVFECYE